MGGGTAVSEVFGVCSQLLWRFAGCPHWTPHVLFRPCCCCSWGDGDRSGSSCRFRAHSHSLCTGQCREQQFQGHCCAERAPEQSRTPAQQCPDLWPMASGGRGTSDITPCALKVTATSGAQRSLLPPCWSRFCVRRAALNPCWLHLLGNWNDSIITRLSVGCHFLFHHCCPIT